MSDDVTNTSILDLRRSNVHAFEEQARQPVVLDRLANRVERIERRLELQD